jgi:MFS family permease
VADRDLLRIYAAALLRAAAAGFLGVWLGLEFARRGYGAVEAGWVVSAGLAGQTLATLGAMVAGDRLGRRRALALLAGLATVGGLAATRVESPAALAAVAFVGLLNGFGRDRGAALVLESAALPGLVDDRRRTLALAVHNVLQDTGHAVGGLLVALVPAALGAAAAPPARGFLLYAALLAPGVLLAATLSARVESAGSTRGARLAPESRRRLARICALFAVDSFAGGFLSSALLAWFFFERFGASAAAIGILFAAARVANALSHLGAAWLARRIGLVPTMVFTHLPSSLLLATVPFAPTFGVAAVLFLLREGLVEMDVPTRQSYVLGILRPEERTFASGATHLVRTLGWTLGPLAAGFATQRFGLAAPLVAAAALKIGYDLALWRSFRALRPPEELER